MGANRKCAICGEPHTSAHMLFNFEYKLRDMGFTGDHAGIQCIINERVKRGEIVDPKSGLPKVDKRRKPKDGT